MVRMQWIWEEAVGVCTRVPAFIWGNKENPRETSVRMVTIGTVTRLWDVCTLGVVTSMNDFSQDSCCRSPDTAVGRLHVW